MITHIKSLSSGAASLNQFSAPYPEALRGWIAGFEDWHLLWREEDCRLARARRSERRGLTSRLVAGP